MKKILVYIVLACIVSACNFSKGTNKDLATGMNLSYNGFRVGKASLVNGQNQVTSSNVVSMGEKVAIVVEDIENYEQENGHVFPKLDLIVTDKNGGVALEGNDIVGNDDGYTPEDAAIMRGTVTVGDPMRPGETYHAKMTITDKLKPENIITVEVDLVVK